MDALDARIFYLVNHGCANPFFDIVMPLVTELGTSEAIFVLSLLPLTLARKGKRRVALLLWAGLTVAYLVSNALKPLFGRPRPFLVFPDAHCFGSSHSGSFPSGHSLTAFMAATVTAGYLRGRGAYFALASLVAFSRVYVGMHFLTDVLAGAFLGIMIGYALLRIDTIS